MGLLDTIKPAERSYFLGLLADGLQGFNEWAQKPTQTQQMQGLPEMLGLLGTQRTLNRLSYGDPITNIGKANVPMIPQDTFDAAMLVGGLADPAAKALNAGAAAVGKRIAPAVERTVPAIMNRGGLPAQLMQDMSQGTQSPMIVWHGSPHKFDKFDASKIGTGEGAQAYGHGLYVAESPAVAKDYADKLPDASSPFTYLWKGGSFEGGTKGDPIAHALGLSYHQGTSVAKRIAKQGLQDAKAGEPYALELGGVDYYQRMLNAAQSMKKSEIKAQQGSLYKIDLPDEHIAKMLDWDKPLSQQHPDVQKALLKQGIGGSSAWDEITGPNLINQLGERLGGKNNSVAASEFLQQQGIPGIRYLDGGSRGTGAGTSNFVIFPGNEGLLSILERNGQALP